MSNIIRLGGIDYVLTEVKDLHHNGADFMGLFNYAASEIKIEENLSPQIKRVTIWHEIVHGLLLHAGEEHDEKITEIISHGIFQVLADNPWLRE